MFEMLDECSICLILKLILISTSPLDAVYITSLLLTLPSKCHSCGLLNFKVHKIVPYLLCVSLVNHKIEKRYSYFTFFPFGKNILAEVSHTTNSILDSVKDAKGIALLVLKRKC